MTVERCSGCPYKPTGRRKEGLVGSTGPIDAPVCIVGEAPGRNEVRKGLPFIGDSGRVLDRALELAGFKRDEVFITNALLCRPTESPPSEESIVACQERLWQEVAAYDRTVILALGNTAMRSLTDNFKLKITAERGRVHEDPLGTIMPSFHPASILRSRGEWHHFVADVRYAAALAGGAAPKTPGEVKYEHLVSPKYATLPNHLEPMAKPERPLVAALRQAVDRLVEQDYLAIDIETSTWEPDEFYPAGVPGRILNFGVAWDVNKAFVFDGALCYDEGTRAELVRLFSARKPRFIWHNGKFDTKWLRLLDIPARVDEDTMLMHYVLDESKGTHGLEQLGQSMLGADDWKARLRRDFPAVKQSFANVPVAGLALYNAKDVDATLQLFHQLNEKMQRSKVLTKLYSKLLVPASEFLYGVERAGLKVDLDHLNILKAMLEKQAEDALEVLHEAIESFWDPLKYQAFSGAKKPPKFFNPSSHQQVAWCLVQVYGKDAPYVRQADVAGRGRVIRGKVVISTREEHLVKLAPTPFVKSLLSYREAVKRLGTFGEGIRSRIKADGRIHSTYQLHTTETGRLSSRDPNLQNIPHDPQYRNIFHTPPGRSFVELDYSQMELRLLAHFSGDEWLKGVYVNKRNLHDEVARAMFGDDYGYPEKMRAKALNFGIAYGRNDLSISQEFNITIKEAQAMRDAYFARMPKVLELITRLRAQVRTGQTMVTPFGRRRRFGVITKDFVVRLENEAANFPMQSVTSDLTLYSAMTVTKEFKKYGVDAFVVNLVHDSILIECDDSIIADVAAAARETMLRLPVTILKATVPFDVSVGTGKRWGEMKDYEVPEGYTPRYRSGRGGDSSAVPASVHRRAQAEPARSAEHETNHPPARAARKPVRVGREAVARSVAQATRLRPRRVDGRV